MVKAAPEDEKDLTPHDKWKMAEIGDLIEVKYGKGLPERSRKPSGVPVYGSNGVIGQHDSPMTKGPTIIIGRKGTVGAVHFSELPCWPIDTTYFVDDFGELDPKFLLYALRSKSLSSLDTSTAIPGLNRNELYKQEIPVPHIEEQRFIVAKIEELLPKVNAVRERLIRVKEIMKRFRQSVLSAACSGRLTEEWRERIKVDEPADELVKKILSEKSVVQKEDMRLRGADLKQQTRTETNPALEGDAPDTWVVASMDMLTSLVTSGSRAWKKYYSEDGPGTFIMGQNVKPFRLEFPRRVRVNPPEGDPDRRRSKVIEGDVLVTIAGNTGDVCRVSQNLKDHYICQSVALLRPVLPSISPFLELYLNSPLHGQSQFRERVYGEGRPHLSFEHLKELCVLLPPLQEQYEICSRVSSLFNLADKMERRVEVELSLTEEMTQAILAKAFRGELVL
jgi:type I restriction enzyme S subunit